MVHNYLVWLNIYRHVMTHKWLLAMLVSWPYGWQC